MIRDPSGGVCGLHDKSMRDGAPQLKRGERYGARSETRHFIRADQDWAEDVAQSVLSGAALHWGGLGPAWVSGGASFLEGRRGLGGDQHGVLFDSSGVGRHAPFIGAHL